MPQLSVTKFFFILASMLSFGDSRIMSDLPILTTLTFFFINGAAFMIAIQLPPGIHRRLAYAPIIYGAGALSVQASSHVTWLLGIIPSRRCLSSVYQLTCEVTHRDSPWYLGVIHLLRAFPYDKHSLH